MMNLGEKSSLLELVKKDSESLRDLLNDFSLIVNTESIPLFCFFEQYRSNVTAVVKQFPLPKYEV
jgi:hypothetical protein